MNWEAFKDKVREKTNNIFVVEELQRRDDIDADAIEGLYSSWYETIDQSLEETLPKTKCRYFLHARDSNYLKLLELTYRGLTTKPYCRRADLGTLKELQRRIREENLRLYKKAWEENVENLKNVYKDSSKFWNGVGRLIGNPKETRKNIYLTRM